MKRAQQDLISKDLIHKMVFLTGPRQVSETSLKTLRTKEKKEVDFVLVVENEPVSMLKIKLSDSQISSTFPKSIANLNNHFKLTPFLGDTILP